ncbi:MULTISPECIES: GntR family transcriptional regulator [Microbacterium]|uniref:Putative transcriptional regulator, GntR family protein n=3 Tax=Microbacterium TaxID=33882 RepID=A0A4Y4BE87_MICMQ|nr:MULTISPECIES: GntR family transcriptional regulator [Microbacterium]KTR77371.1 hypothetical protein NS234_07070 [Microbacterium oxydans]MDN3446000.1 GntR family transcriptional regulator [Microbacterium sp. APC 3901]GEC77107.1 putative transcriptional regulator, GntR family protein [Microbacterium liquefaciens]GGV66641.1 putative transcriptional regulator, GntR family protein [Microbacterium liquefaciens]
MTESGAASHASASEVAYHHLRAQILDGALLGGSMISEGMVANELGMSRTPVREAFLRLQGEGWLRLYPKRGAFVVEVRPHEREEIVRARVLLESDAVSRVSGDARLRSELVERLQTILGGQRDAAAREDLHGFAVLDADFHAAVVDAGGNRLLSDFFASLSDRQRRMTARSLWKRADRLEGVLDDHTELARLIDGAHSDAFRIALESHIRRTHRELLP